MRALLLPFVCALLTATATGQYFAERQMSPFSPPVTGAIRVAMDADGDGRVDLLTGDSTIDFYRNEGPHNFVLRNSSPAVAQSLSPVVGDIDSDGDLDVLAYHESYENLGNGAFQLRSSAFGVSFIAYEIELLDMDADGDLDVLHGNQLLRNDGNWTFVDVTATHAPGLPVLGGSPTLALDADRDGDVDIVSAAFYFTQTEWSLLRNDGTGQFVAETLQPPTAQVLAIELRAAHLNGDADLDIAVTDFTGAVYALINDGTGSFAMTPYYPAGLLDEHTVWTNWNGDQISDAITDSFIIPGVTAQPYPLRVAYPFRDEAADRVIVADLDGDLDLDVVLAESAIVYHTQSNWVWGSRMFHASPPKLLGPEVLSTVHAAEAEYGAQSQAMVLAEEAGVLVVLSTAGRRQPTLSTVELTPPVTDFLDVAIASHNGYISVYGSARLSVVACTSTGPFYYQGGAVSLYANLPLPPLGLPDHCAAGNLDGQGRDELVFGGSGFDGPRIVRQHGIDGDLLTEVSPTLPPPPPKPAGAQHYESITIADIDGDGHLDLVHEMRVLRNHGDGSWSVGADLSNLPPPPRDGYLALDFDQDGDMDLIADGTRLLQNNGSHFVEATLGHIPSFAHGATPLSVGDIDGDGDLDLLANYVLRNDNGVFVPIANGAHLSFVDINHDLRPDLLTSTGILDNLHNHLQPRRRAALGANWELEVTTWREGPYPQASYVAIDLVSGSAWSLPYLPLGRVGMLAIDPAAAIITPIPLAGGSGSMAVHIPYSISLSGVPVIAQALVLDHELTLTGPVLDWIH